MTVREGEAWKGLYIITGTEAVKVRLMDDGNDDQHFPLLPIHFISLQPIKLKHLSQIKFITFM